MSIASRQLTVLLQGPLFDGAVDLAGRAVESVRRFLPDAQIVLATTDITGVPPFEDVDFVADGSAPYFEDVNGNVNNVNKLISSMINGLSLVKREYCLKMRTDHVLCSDAVLSRMGGGAQGELFVERVAVSNLFLRNPCLVPYLFHLTDTLQFGRTEDLRKLWGIDLLPHDFLFLPDGPRTNPFGTFQGFTSFRLLPEQAIFLRFAQRNGLKLDLEHISHTSFELFSAWENLLAANFEIYDWQNLGIEPPKRFLSAPYAPESVMTEWDLEILRTQNSSLQKALRYADLLINKYLLCWFRRRWLVSVGSLLLFSFSSSAAVSVRNLYRRVSGAGRL
ncbi:hypothetical protein IB260_12910 [Pseudomonas sp. PDM23]|uniref:WavE lipopolysaccharide synthesis family protein n=1 Tax=unclassified Pseudomonas TaxID=196821 RepID=UPI0017854946|nr:MULTISPECIES: WavE lipopolysaccharide synthesis family protein [unclassified Pseudomonas]MBD9576211.1 hypothetical protein [Pseudomonas sp. PDM23]MBD9670138.1 hypothetical protein [Pseudomonas sp. PDM21]